MAGRAVPGLSGELTAGIRGGWQGKSRPGAGVQRMLAAHPSLASADTSSSAGIHVRVEWVRKFALASCARVK